MTSIKHNNAAMNKSTLKSLIFIFILLFIVISLSFAQVEDSLQKPDATIESESFNQDISNKEIGYQQQEEVGNYFGLDSGKATLQSLTQGEITNIEKINNQIIVKGRGNFKLEIKGENGERTYENFQYNEGENQLVFDEKNELTEGTKFKTKGKEDETKQEQTYDIKGYEITLRENDEVDIKKDFSEISIAKANKIITPKKIRNLESAEEPIFKFKAIEGALLEEGSTEGTNLQGILNFQNENYFHNANENLVIEGVNIGTGSIDSNQNGRTNIYFDLASEDSSLIPAHKGSWLKLNKDKGILVTGTNNDKNGPIIDITSSNSYIKYSETDGLKRNLVIQALGDSKGSRIELIDKTSEDKLAQMNIFGPALANLDNKGIRNDVASGDLFLRVNGIAIEGLADASGTSTVPMKISFYNSEGKPLNQQNLDFYANAHLQFASIPKDFQWEQEGIFKTNKGFSIYPRLKYNYLQLEYQEVISTLTSEQRLALENNGFFEMTPGKQQELLKKYSRIEIEPEQEETPYEDIERPGEILGGQIKDISDSSLKSASVRVRVAGGVGSGTVIGTVEENGQKYAVVLTAGHVIKGGGKGGQTELDFFGTGKTLTGTIVDYDMQTDTGLIKVPIGNKQIPFAKVAPQGYNLNLGQDVTTAGCDLGADCSIRRTKTRRRMFGGPTFETEDTPIEGRSGGGVFDNNGRVIGVTSRRIGGGMSEFGYEPSEGGIYSDLNSIHNLLKKNNMSFLFKLILIFLRTNNSFILLIHSTFIIEGFE